MNDYQVDYYRQMRARDRLYAFRNNGKLYGIVTYYIGNGDINRYVRDDPWQVIEDEPQTGDTVYIDHLISNKRVSDNKMRFKFWKQLRVYLKKKYPQIIKIRGNRYKGGKVHVYSKIFK